MSTPSPQPLDYDLVSPYAQKQDGDPLLSSAQGPVAPTAGSESDNDAKILEEIEQSLRAMITAEHAPKAEADPQDEAKADGNDNLSGISPQQNPAPEAIDAPGIADPADERMTQEQRYYEAIRVQEVLQQVSHQLSNRGTREAPPLGFEPVREFESAPEREIEQFRAPPAFLTRPLEPMQLDETEDESWPKVKPRTRSSASKLFVRFGFAAGGAAAVMMFALPEVRSRLYSSVETPLASLSSNASAVFGEGRPAPAKVEAIAPVAVRTEPVILPKDPDDLRSSRLATANLSPMMPEPRIAANVENVPPQRETVMLPQRPAPENTLRQQAIWHGPPGRVEADTPTVGVAARPLAAEEIELLRKMGNDFIAAGDFAGARSVLERAADAGDASAALALAGTYDPAALARFKVKGLVPDSAKAAFWYERARDLGSQEAPTRLKAMARTN